MPANNVLEAADLRQAITDLGIAGVTIDPTTYPDNADGLLLIRNLTKVFTRAQEIQNDFADAGSDVQFTREIIGDDEQREYPPGSGTIRTIRPVRFELAFNDEVTVTSVVPDLA